MENDYYSEVFKLSSGVVDVIPEDKRVDIIKRMNVIGVRCDQSFTVIRSIRTSLETYLQLSEKIRDALTKTRKLILGGSVEVTDGFIAEQGRSMLTSRRISIKVKMVKLVRHWE